MPYDNMNVQYRGKRGSMHAWYVYESGMIAQTYESMSPVGPNVLAVMFDRRSECWTCDCAPNDLQSTERSKICDHVYVVCKQLVGAKGPWEQDAELMQKAWDAVRPRVRRGMPYKGKVSGLKADKLIVDEFNEHKEPEKPKKRKSRFTEIDL